VFRKYTVKFIPAKSNPPKRIEIASSGIGTIVAKQLSREVRAKGHEVIMAHSWKVPEMKPEVYLEIIESDDNDSDIIVAYPESGGDRHRIMAQSVAMFVSNSTNLDVGVQPLDDLEALGCRFVDLPIEGNSKNLAKDFILILKIYNFYNNLLSLSLYR